MLPEGVAKLWAPDFADGPFPEHYEAAEHPVANALHEKQASNPVAPVFRGPLDPELGTPEKGYDVVATTFRLTEHFHYWTKHIAPTVAIQPEFFVEIPEGLAASRGIRNEDRVRVSTPRGSVEGRALVTKRIRPLAVGGKPSWQIAIPIHWGFAGRASGAKEGRGPLANLLTPTVVDPNSFTPEYKTFLVKLEKV
jgi:formate dehydrogenase major subunit